MFARLPKSLQRTRRGLEVPKEEHLEHCPAALEPAPGTTRRARNNRRSSPPPHGHAAEIPVVSCENFFPSPLLLLKPNHFDFAFRQYTEVVLASSINRNLLWFHT